MLVYNDLPRFDPTNLADMISIAISLCGGGAASEVILSSESNKVKVSQEKQWKCADIYRINI
jgi:hypothetical protein